MREELNPLRGVPPTEQSHLTPPSHLRRRGRAWLWAAGFAAGLGFAIFQGWNSSSSVTTGARQLYQAVMTMHPEPHVRGLREEIRREFEKLRKSRGCSWEPPPITPPERRPTERASPSGKPAPSERRSASPGPLDDFFDRLNKNSP